MPGSRHRIADARQRVRSYSSGMWSYTGPPTYYSVVRADDASGVIADRRILLIDHESMDWSRPGQVGDDSESDGLRTTERKLMAAVLIVDDSAADRALLDRKSTRLNS